MRPEDWITDPVKVESLIKKWRGEMVQVWGYSVSHSQLMIRIHCERQPVDMFSLYLYFKGCNRVAFESFWKNADFEVKVVDGQYSQEIEVSDHGRFFVRCLGGPFAFETEELLCLEGLGA